MIRLIATAAAAGLTFCSGFAVASPAIVFNELTGLNGAQANQNVGFQFDVLSSFTVTGLGWYDEGQDGLSVRHEVGIWDPQGNLLASLILGAGTAEALDGQYRMAAISPIVLAPGSGYIMGGLNSTASTDRLAFDVGMTVQAPINFVDATFSNITSNLERPTVFSAATTGFFGPMFSFQAATQVPEPGSLLLVSLAALALLGTRRRAL